jgi:CelD/BcsL family acetyltransferase involved in cellulose biosynthesis
VSELTLEPVEDPASLREEWNALAERAANLFATWEWADAWWRVYGEGRPLWITACRGPAGELVALLPLYLASRRPVRTLRFLGHGPADQLGPVCAPEHRQEAASALQRLLRSRSREWDLLIAERLAPAEGWPEAIGGHVVHTEESPSLTIGGLSFDEFLATRSRNFREQVRRRERKLRREHEVAFRLSDRDRLEADLDALFSLHGARWEDDSDALAGARARFHRDFAMRALERGWLRLWLLEVDGAPRAAWYGFRFARRYWYYQSGRDPAWERQSVGFVLLAHTVRQAFDEGMLEYRLLRGGEEYKGRFSSDDYGVETLALPRGMAGRAALLAARAARAMPAGARRRLVKLAG